MTRNNKPKGRSSLFYITLYFVTSYCDNVKDRKVIRNFPKVVQIQSRQREMLDRCLPWSCANIIMFRRINGMFLPRRLFVLSKDGLISNNRQI